MTVIFRHRGGIGNLCAVVRTNDGVFDVQRIGERWRCSCGTANGCDHVARVEQALVVPVKATP
jgi:hypothetical protein